MLIAGIGDLDDFGSLSTVPTSVKVSTSKKAGDKSRITVMYAMHVADSSTFYSVTSFTCIHHAALTSEGCLVYVHL